MRELWISWVRKWNSVVQDIRLLPMGRRMIFGSSLFLILMLFLPWFWQASVWFTAFGKVPIFGILYLTILLLSICFIVREAVFRKAFFLSYSHSHWFLGLFGIGFYTVIIQTFVFYELMTYNPRSDIGIGIMLAFIGFGIGMAGAYLSRKFFPDQNKKTLFRDFKNLETKNLPLEKEGQLSFSNDT